MSVQIAPPGDEPRNWPNIISALIATIALLVSILSSANSYVGNTTSTNAGHELRINSLEKSRTEDEQQMRQMLDRLNDQAIETTKAQAIITERLAIIETTVKQTDERLKGKL